MNDSLKLSVINFDLPVFISATYILCAKGSLYEVAPKNANCLLLGEMDILDSLPGVSVTFFGFPLGIFTR